MHDLESKLEERTQDVQRLDQKLQKATDDMTTTQRDLTEQKKASEATWAQKLEDERTRWREQILIPPTPNFANYQSRNESPSAYSRRPINLEPTTTLGSLPDSRPTSRRSSTMPFASPDLSGTPPRQNSFPSSAHGGIVGSGGGGTGTPIGGGGGGGGIFTPPTTSNLSNPPLAEPPAIQFEADEFSGLGTPSAYEAGHTHQSRGGGGINDIISESTVGAGPSVQLVERMSATVRRLESERAASKDDLERITSQRDEAREQVVGLMREADQKKTSDARVQELQDHVDVLDQRYQTTLEMLGEKSEQVEELQADIADLKKIYRELVDSTMK